MCIVYLLAEAEKGSITPGKLADLIVLRRDIPCEPPATIKDIPLEMTIVAGAVRYRRGEESPTG